MAGALGTRGSVELVGDERVAEKRGIFMVLRPIIGVTVLLSLHNGLIVITEGE